MATTGIYIANGQMDMHIQMCFVWHSRLIYNTESKTTNKNKTSKADWIVTNTIYSYNFFFNQCYNSWWVLAC